MNEGLGRKITSNVKVTFLGTIASGLIQAVVMVTLARLLNPLDYGLYAIGVSITALTTGFVASCFERSIFLDSDELKSGHLNMLVPAAIVAVGALTVMGMQLANSFFGMSLPISITAGVMLVNLINSLSIFSKIKLRRAYNFTALICFELISQIFGVGLVTIGMAYFGFGVLAIISGVISQALIFWALSLIFVEKRIRFSLDLHEFKYLFSTAVKLGKSIVLEVVNGQIPTMIISSFLGAVAMGSFNRAFSLVQLPIQLLTNSMNRVITSGLKDVAADTDRLLRGVRRLVMTASMLISPIVGGIIGSCNQFTFVILGPKWLAGAPLIPFLAISTWAVMLGSLFGILAESTRRFRLKIVVQGVSSALLAIAMLFGVCFGLKGAVIGMAVGSVLFLLAYVFSTRKIVEANLVDIVAWFIPGVSCGAICFGGSILISYMFERFNNYEVFSGQIFACGAICVLFYSICYNSIFIEIINMFIPSKKKSPQL